MRYFLALALWLLPVLAVAPGEAVNLPKVQDSYGKPLDLPGLSKEGKYLVFFFYPAAFTSICSLETKRYADLYGEFQKLGAAVFGVSGDPAKEQCAFAQQLAFKGAMIPDGKGVLARLFGVQDFGGIFSRDTIVVGPPGRIQQIWRNVDGPKDADRVLAYLRGLKP
ncbi:MAG: peroxiredoxin [Thermaceae bacterium]|nr:peroxiredoxin [Thermaceae bacterium]